VLTPLLFSFNSGHFRTEIVGSMEDLRAKVEGRRNKMKELQDSRRFGELGILKRLSLFPPFLNHILTPSQ